MIDWRGKPSSPPPNLEALMFTKIPITQNLHSTEVVDLVGVLEIPREMADTMAQCFGNGVGFKLQACVLKDGDKFTLKHLIIASVPADESSHAKPCQCGCVDRVCAECGEHS